MDTTTIKERELQEEALFEDDDTQEEQQEPGMTDEELKIESLKIATNIGKLMNNVTTEDIVNIAETVAKFIKGGDSTSLETVESDEDFDTDEEDTESDEESSDSEENFETKESDEEAAEESDENKEENFEV